MPTRTGKHAARPPRGRLATTLRVVGAAAVTVAAAAAAVQGGAWATAWDTAASASVSTPVSLPTVGASAGQPGGEIRTQLARERQVRVSRDSSRQVLQDSTGKGTLKSPGSAERKQSNGDVVRLAASAERVAGQVRKDAWQLPIPRGVYHLTARFGQCSGLWSHCHTGLDFAAPTGTPIHAVAGGKVTEVGWAGAYGNRTEIRLEDGTVLWYCHQDSIAVRAGQRVFGGQVIGAVGSTGNTTGPHLHLEVRPGGGDPVDPYRALSVRGVTP